ncbi:MAG: BLUF domain-containing protein [Brevundimonas sp.]|uniref:BLUF domain-containing protein n=1 Tax=Brevundimonas sp. TaxID=1871086 RepID=UPI0025C4F666|nr:BLUF domain-containing protein [Brevundimonas sp.]MBX3478638.1 BLUF domain-containing protein [Brevundimonas sp.]
MTDLHRVIYVSETVGTTGRTTLSIAHILGAAARNNRRDRITGVILFCEGRVLQAVEGMRGDVDRLMARLRADPRHTGMRLLSDAPVRGRRFHDPMALCGLTEPTLARLLAGRRLTDLTPREAEDMLASCIVAPAEAA